VLTDAGLARPRSQDVEDFAAEISAERIKDADADAIFVTAYADDKGLGTKTLEQFKANPLGSRWRRRCTRWRTSPG
jgi:iron complex transport system substrate-binding protein